MMNSTYKLDLSSGASLTTSRSRLAGITVGWQSGNLAGTNRMSISSFDFDNLKIRLKNGSSGDELFGMCPPLGRQNTFSAIPYSYNFGNARILFPDGIYLEAVNGISNKAEASKAMIVIFYE
jgi:hypothetical protein